MRTPTARPALPAFLVFHPFFQGMGSAAGLHLPLCANAHALTALNFSSDTQFGLKFGTNLAWNLTALSLYFCIALQNGVSKL